MNFLKKPKVLPKDFIKILYDCYVWGFNDAKGRVQMRSFEEVEKSLNAGFKVGVKRG